MTVRFWKINSKSAEYVLLKLIGQGGMGKVFSGNRLCEEGVVMPVAVKVMSGPFSDRDRERFFNEARISTQLVHSCIVSVIDVGEIKGAFDRPGTPFLVMEWVDGVDLRKLQKRVGHPFSLVVAIFIAGQALFGLKHAHGYRIAGVPAGVVHFDVTPGNIMITSSGDVKLADFGIARFAGLIEGTLSQAVGTPRYMSPEQLDGKGDEKTDIFSLALVIIELINGERINAHLDNAAHQSAILRGRVPELKVDLPPEWQWLEDLLRRMLALDPNDRPTAADARALILKKAHQYNLGYQLGGEQLAEMYAEFIGNQRSGLTGLFELEDLGLEYKLLPVPPLVAARALQGKEPQDAAGTDEPTAVQPADEDAPSFFRRRATPNSTTPPERTYTDGLPPTQPPMLRQSEPPQLITMEPAARSEVSTGGTWPDQSKSEPVVDATIRLPPVFEDDAVAPAPITGQQWPTPLAPADSSTPARSTLQLPTGRPVPASAPAPDSTPAAAASPQPSRNSTPWVVGVLGSAIIILLGVLIGVLVKSNRAEPIADAREPAAEVSSPPREVEPELDLPQPSETEPPPLPAPRLPESDSTEAGPEEPEPDASGDGEAPTVETSATESSTEPVPEVEPEPKPRAKPKPRMQVVLTVTPAVSVAEVKVGSRLLKYKYAATTKLRAGTYKVRWRENSNDPWYEPGSLVVDEIASTKFYDVLLNDKRIVAIDVREKGSAK